MTGSVRREPISCKVRERRTGRVHSSEGNAADGWLSARPQGAHTAHQCLELPCCVDSELCIVSVVRYWTGLLRMLSTGLASVQRCRSKARMHDPRSCPSPSDFPRFTLSLGSAANYPARFGRFCAPHPALLGSRIRTYSPYSRPAGRTQQRPRSWTGYFVTDPKFDLGMERLNEH